MLLYLKPAILPYTRSDGCITFENHSAAPVLCEVFHEHSTAVLQLSESEFEKVHAAQSGRTAGSMRWPDCGQHALAGLRATCAGRTAGSMRWPDCGQHALAGLRTALISLQADNT